VERHVLLCGHTVQRFHPDYGYDLILSSFNERGEAEGGVVFFQVKATEELPLLKDGKTISWPIDRRDIPLWLNESFPVLLVVYDARRNRGFCLHLQKYLAAVPQPELFARRATFNVHLPITHRVNGRAIQKIV
jgi:hypothetical protein